MKILHILPDDKFWAIPISIFTETEAQNEYFCIVDDITSVAKYVDGQSVTIVCGSDASALWQRKDVDMYMFHSIPFRYYDYVLAIPHDKLVAVFSWGYDIYYPVKGCRPICDIGTLFMPRTKKLLDAINREPFHVVCYRTLKSFARRLLTNNVNSKYSSEQDRQNTVLERIDYWSTVVPPEFGLLKKNPHIRAEYLPFTYSSRRHGDLPSRIDDTLADQILVGNSADPTNNHLDIFAVLRERGINGNLYIPMAYGEEVYRHLVIEYLQRAHISGHVQTDMMPYADYQKTLSSCRAGVFGHIRQQAHGNVLLCLLQGSKVFLYKSSPIYQHLKSLGCIIYSIEDDLSLEAIKEPVSDFEYETNISAVEGLTIENVALDLSNALKSIEMCVK